MGGQGGGMGGQGGGMGGPPSLAPLNKHAGAAGRGGDSVVGGYGGAGVILGSYARNARYRPGVQPANAKGADKLPQLAPLNRHGGAAGRNSGAGGGAGGQARFSRHDGGW